jgi:hypothetical protein
LKSEKDLERWGREKMASQADENKSKWIGENTMWTQKVDRVQPSLIGQ